MSVDRRERWPFSASVGVLLENGGKFGPQGKFDYGLVLVRKSNSGKWGLPAGGVESGEIPDVAALRELFEETGISEDRLESGLSTFRYNFYPRSKHTSIGILLLGHLRNPIKHEGYSVSSNEIDYVRPFTRGGLRELIRKPQEIYRPDLNVYAIKEWLEYMRSPYDVI